MNTEQVFLKPLAGGASVRVSGEVLIGRSEDCDLVLKGGYPSRKHARLSLQEGAARLEDLGSSNGTFVNGERISEPVSLKDGDRVRFDILEFDFVSIPAEADRTQLRPAAAARPPDGTQLRPSAAPPPAAPPPAATPNAEPPAARAAAGTAPPAARQPAATPVAEPPAPKAAAGNASPAPVPGKPAPAPAAEKPAPAAEKPAAPQAAPVRKPGSWVDPDSHPEGGTKFLTREEIEKLRSETPALRADTEVDQPCLQVCSGSSRGKNLQLKGAQGQNEWGVGSDAARDFVLEDEGVSAYHAKIVHVGDRWKLIDQMSANGTWVNGRKASISYLTSGDRIKFGPVECVFHAPAARRQASGSWFYWSLGLAAIVALAIGFALWRWLGS